MEKVQKGLFFVLLALFNSSLSCCEACDRHAEGRAGDVVEADLVAELDGGRIAAVLTADTAVEFGTGRTAELDRHLHQLADAHRVETGEGIGFVDLVRIVCGQELAGVVAREAERHLGEVVRTEAEELRFLGDVVCGKGCTRDLDHGADLILELDARLRDGLVRRLDDDVLDELHFLDFARERDHDLGNDVPVGMTALDGDRCLDNGVGLHDGDLGIGDGKAAAAVTHHGVELVEIGDDLLDLRDRLSLCLCERFDVCLVRGNELMERGIEEADGDGIAAERFEEAFKVSLLHGLDLGERSFALLDRLGADHLAEGLDAAFAEEHVLGTAEADALRAERSRLLCILGRIGIGADAERLVLICKLHDAAEVTAVGIGGNGRDERIVDLTGGAVEGERVTFLEDFAGEGIGVPALII